MHRAVLLLLLASSTAYAGDLGLVVYYGPAAPGTRAVAAHERAARHARSAGVAFVDVSATPPAPAIAVARLRAGVDAYEELRWDDALAALDAAADDAWRTGAEGLSTTDLSDVFLYRGLVQTQRGDATKAWDDLVRAAAIAPTRTLDPLRFPPRAVEAFGRALDAVGKLGHASLSVDAPECDVAIDGGTGAIADLPDGEHAVRVVCPGAAPWGERVVVDRNVAVTPPPAPPPPDEPALARLARDRGVARLLAVVVSERGTATAGVIVIGDDGHVASRSSVALGDDAAPLDAALDAALKPPAPTRHPWWRSRWVWAAAGVVVTAAVLGPFVGSGGSGSDTATLIPQGWRW